jgi:hypothetical protein
MNKKEIIQFNKELRNCYDETGISHIEDACYHIAELFDEVKKLEAENKELRQAQDYLKPLSLSFIYNGETYPYIQRASCGEKLITTISPDVNGDFMLLELHSSDGMRLVDFISKDVVKIQLPTPPEV